MPNPCPSCGKPIEDGQTTCTCGWRRDGTPPGGSVVMVLFVVGLVVVLLISVIVGAGVILWSRLSHVATMPSQTSAPTVQATPAQTPTPEAGGTPVTMLPSDRGGSASEETPTTHPAIEPARVAESPVAKATPGPATAPLSAEQWLLKELHSPDRERRKRAASTLQLRGWEPSNDEQAALVLVAMDNPLAAERYGDAAVEALCLPLAAGNAPAFLSVGAAESLGRLLDARAVQPLCRAMRESSDANVRAAAATALGRIRDPASIPALEQALAKESDDPTRQRITGALAKVTESKDADRLLAALKDDEPKVQFRAAALLVRRGDDHGVAWLEQTVNADDTTLRGQAIDMLRQLASPAAIQVLVRRVGGPGFDGPAEAVDALAQIGAPAVQPMVNALPRLGANAQRVMLAGLVRIGEAAMPALTKTVSDGSIELKKTACDTLGRLEDRDDVPHKPVEPLIALLGDSDADVRRLAAHGLELLKWEPTDAAQRERFAKAKNAGRE